MFISISCLAFLTLINFFKRGPFLQELKRKKVHENVNILFKLANKSQMYAHCLLTTHIVIILFAKN